MDNQTIVTILGFLVMMISVISPIIKLNTSITKLNITLDNFQNETRESHNTLQKRVSEHGKEIDALNERLIAIEARQERS